MKFFLILAALIAFSYGQTVHPTQAPHTGSTHEPNEQESFHFFYDYYTHKMMVVNNENCYIFQLSDQERVYVHTTNGMMALEMKYLPMVHSVLKTEVQKSSLEATVVEACEHNIKHYYTVS